MANRYVMDANKGLGSVYNPAVSATQATAGGTMSLYDGLIDALGTQQMEGTDTVLDSANRRGVLQGSLGDQIGGALEQERLMGEAQYGAGEAEDLAAIAGYVGKLKGNRISDAVEGGKTRQDTAIAKGEYKFNVAMSKAEAKLQIQQLERDADFKQKQAAYEAAQAAAYSSGGGESSTEAAPGEKTPPKVDKFDQLLEGLGRKAGNGDSRAATALNQIKIDPFWKKNKKTYVKMYGKFAK